ncbi:MAG: twin-arginine translocation signal domain-containing protein [Bacteroidales bacterium]|nr:twin-arginine translocation signal domain-containing protein [Bacteroidales bacterium]
MDRRDFIKASTLAGAGLLIDWENVFARGTSDKAVGNPWSGWKKGQFQVHFIYTGVAESMFMIFPDGTTMLLDCGDHDAIGRGEKAVPVLPDASRHAGEWIARYVQRVNPAGSKVDYMMLSHYHSDHGGSEMYYADKVMRGGEEYMLSGFSHAAEFLSFGKAFDRCWPTYDDPLPLLDDGAKQLTHMRKFYDYMQKERGMKIEKFRLGASDQIVPVRGSIPGFSVRNICANGRIAYPDGRIVDLYAERKKDNPKRFNENGMSLGMIFSYGPFRFYTAGDFSDKWKLPDGSTYMIEDAMAEVCGEADVAKLNHHGHYSMPAKLVGALRARVWVSCVWDTLHNVPPVMETLTDRSIYPGERIVCPGVFPVQRRTQDAGSPWLSDVNKASFDGGHMVLTVEKGGKKYSMTYIGASDEDMIVRSVMHFKTKGR